MKKATIIMMCLLTLTSLFFPFSVKADKKDSENYNNYARNCIYQDGNKEVAYIDGIEDNVLLVRYGEDSEQREVPLNTIKNLNLLKDSCPAYFTKVNGNIEFSNTALPYDSSVVYKKLNSSSEIQKTQVCEYQIKGDYFEVKLDDENATVLLYKNGKSIRNPFPTKGNEFIMPLSEVRQSLINGTCPRSLVYKSGGQYQFSTGAQFVLLGAGSVLLDAINNLVNWIQDETYFLTNNDDWKANGIGDNKAPGSENNGGNIFGPGGISGDNCTDVLDDGLVEFLQEIFNYMKFFAPVLVILLGSLDFGKAVVSSDEKELKNATNRFIKRLIAAVALFFLPYLLNAILSYINEVDGTCGITYIWR